MSMASIGDVELSRVERASQDRKQASQDRKQASRRVVETTAAVLAHQDSQDRRTVLVQAERDAADAVLAAGEGAAEGGRAAEDLRRRKEDLVSFDRVFDRTYATLDRAEQAAIAAEQAAIADHQAAIAIEQAAIAAGAAAVARGAATAVGAAEGACVSWCPCVS